jgi:acyl-CoA reductase-like NAD-dependent aldehyde dehydrogenase
VITLGSYCNHQAAPPLYTAGGSKQSGFGRAAGREDLVDYTELKAIYLRLGR